MKNVSAAIIRNAGNILLARRGPKEKLAGYWEFPGGKQEADETIEECLIRELSEEFAVKVKCSNLLISNIHEYDSGAINLIAIETEILEGVITLTVHDKVAWVKTKDIFNYKLAPADIPIAEWLINGIYNRNP